MKAKINQRARCQEAFFDSDRIQRNAQEHAPEKRDLTARAGHTLRRR
ncbi:MAG TPA: hypothetical protein VMV87_18880 [Burkholderiales bacterium]|nr:hypothetical protein [Burkholderiales bacterium]